MEFKEFEVIGRKTPVGEEVTPLIKMSIFAKNSVVAKSKFWSYMRRLKKIKKTSGDLIRIRQLESDKQVVKNFGIWVRVRSHRNIQNMSFEFRATSRSEAVNKCYKTLAGNHSARAYSVDIIRVEVVPAGDCRRAAVKQFHNSTLSYRPYRKVNKGLLPNRFTTTRPSTYY